MYSDNKSKENDLNEQKIVQFDEFRVDIQPEDSIDAVAFVDEEGVEYTLRDMMTIDEEIEYAYYMRKLEREEDVLDELDEGLPPDNVDLD